MKSTRGFGLSEGLPQKLIRRSTTPHAFQSLSGILYLPAKSRDSSLEVQHVPLHINAAHPRTASPEIVRVRKGDGHPLPQFVKLITHGGAEITVVPWNTLDGPPICQGTRRLLES